MVSLAELKFMRYLMLSCGCLRGVIKAGFRRLDQLRNREHLEFLCLLGEYLGGALLSRFSKLEDVNVDMPPLLTKEFACFITGDITSCAGNFLAVASWLATSSPRGPIEKASAPEYAIMTVTLNLFILSMNAIHHQFDIL
jgi:hypothetical protein